MTGPEPAGTQNRNSALSKFGPGAVVSSSAWPNETQGTMKDMKDVKINSAGHCAGRPLAHGARSYTHGVSRHGGGENALNQRRITQPAWSSADELERSSGSSSAQVVANRDGFIELSGLRVIVLQILQRLDQRFLIRGDLLIGLFLDGLPLGVEALHEVLAVGRQIRHATAKCQVPCGLLRWSRRALRARRA